MAKDTVFLKISRHRVKLHITVLWGHGALAGVFIFVFKNQTLGWLTIQMQTYMGGTFLLTVIISLA